MNCREIKNRLNLLVGQLTIDDSIKRHLDSCPDCRKFYKELQQLEKTMRSASFEPITATEFAQVQERLDNRINGYLTRAVGFYHLMVRYGTSLAAVCLLLFISLVSDMNLEQNGVSDNSLSYQQLTYNSQVTEDDYLEAEYIDDLFYDYVQNHGSNAGELLLGELYEEEYEYLNENINVGDIL